MPESLSKRSTDTHRLRTVSDKENEPRAPRGIPALVAWLNRRLLPILGPPPLGPYTTESPAETQQHRAEATCPVCHQLMSLHEIDRSGEKTQITHPAAH